MKFQQFTPALIFTALSMVLVSCGQSTTSGEGDNPAIVDTDEAVQATSEIECTGIELAQTSSKPAEPVALNGLPEGVPLEAFSAVFATGDSIVTLPLTDLDGTPSVVIPFYPDVFEGGDIEITISTGTTECIQTGFNVKALEPAPGATQSYFDTLNEYLEMTRRLYGVSREDLVTDAAASLPAHMLPLAYAQRMVDGPDYDNSLKAVLEGTAPILEENDFDTALLDAVIAQLELQDRLKARIEANQELLDLLEQESASLHRASPASQQGIEDIATAAALHIAMVKQDECEGKYEGALGKLKKDVKDISYRIAQALTTPLPGIWKYVAKAALFIENNVDLGCEFLLPSEFGALSASGTILWFPDEWVGTPGAITTTEVTALSKELDFNKVVKDLTAGIDDQTSQQQLNDMADDLCSLIDACDPNKPELGPIQYGPIDVTGSTWTEAETINDVLSVTDGDLHSYSPEQIGTGGVRINTHPEFFGDATPAETTIEVLVDDCVDTGVRPIEGSYVYNEVPLKLYCITPQGPTTQTGGGDQTNVQLDWVDEYACKIQVTGGDGQLIAARVSATAQTSVYQGILVQGTSACGLTMSWSELSQNFLGEVRCHIKGPGFTCQGETTFTKTP